MSKEKLIHIGTFGKALGLKGEVKIIIYTSNVKSFFNYKPLLLEEDCVELDLNFNANALYPGLSQKRAVVEHNWRVLARQMVQSIRQVDLQCQQNRATSEPNTPPISDQVYFAFLNTRRHDFIPEVGRIPT